MLKRSEAQHLSPFDFAKGLSLKSFDVAQDGSKDGEPVEPFTEGRSRIIGLILRTFFVLTIHFASLNLFFNW